MFCDSVASLHLFNSIHYLLRISSNGLAVYDFAIREVCRLYDGSSTHPTRASSDCLLLYTKMRRANVLRTNGIGRCQAQNATTTGQTMAAFISDMHVAIHIYS